MECFHFIQKADERHGIAIDAGIAIREDKG